MCMGKPKVPKPEKAPDPAIIRNPYLDGVDPATRALRKGRSTLRIERGGGRVAPVTPAPVVPTTPQTPAPAAGGGYAGSSPVYGGGGGGRNPFNTAYL